MTPFSERGSAVLLEDIAAIEVAVPIEVIMDRGVDGSELLQRLYISEIRHRSFSSPERLVGILGSIVEPPTALLIGSIADYLHRRSVRPKPVGYDRSRSAVTLHRALQELQRGPAIPALRGENLEYLAFVINGPPQVMRLAVDPRQAASVSPPSTHSLA